MTFSARSIFWWGVGLAVGGHVLDRVLGFALTAVWAGPAVVVAPLQALMTMIEFGVLPFGVALVVLAIVARSVMSDAAARDASLGMPPRLSVRAMAVAGAVALVVGVVLMMLLEQWMSSLTYRGVSSIATDVLWVLGPTLRSVLPLLGVLLLAGAVMLRLLGGPEQRSGTARDDAARPETQRPETQRPETQRPETQRPETQRPETQSPGGYDRVGA